MSFGSITLGLPAGRSPQHSTGSVRGRPSYGDPQLLKFPLDDVGSAAGRAADLADPATRVSTRGEVLTVGDYLTAYVLEWTPHHLDLTAHLPSAAEPPAEPLAAACALLCDKDALLVGTGRRPPTDAEKAALGDFAAKLPCILG